MKEVSVSTIYTKERLNKFFRIYFFDKIVVIRIIVNILAIVSIFYFFRLRDITNLDIVKFVLMLFCIVYVNTSMIPKFNYFRLTKKKKNIINSTFSYKFTKTNFCVIHDKKEFVSFSELYKVIETNTDFYLYLDRTKVFIVSKEDLLEKDINFITNNLKDKVSTYVVKNV